LLPASTFVGRAGPSPRDDTGIVPFYLLGSLAFLLHATLGIPGGDTAKPRVLVMVHMEGRATADPKLAAEAAALARDIWRPHVDVMFARVGDIRRTIEVDQLELVITDQLPPQPSAESGGLGWIQFVNDQPSHRITVSMTAAEQLMANSSWSGRPLPMLPPATRRQFVVRALGRTIAHEMGHYLLRSKDHGRRGLMRDHFTADEIMAPRYIKDRLESDELKRLDGRLNEYAAAIAGTKPPA
jgi:hypothetical protein